MVYIKAKGKKAWASRFLRFLAIVGGVLGALAPIISAMVPRGEDALLQLQITQAGYLAVGIAAGALALDRFSGGSTGWIRYMTAMTMIERLRLEFTLDWAKMRWASSPPQAADILTALECVSVFRKALLQVVEDETKAWATEFQSQMSNLDKYVQDARTAAEASLKDAENQRAGLQVGSINLTITGAWDGEAEILDQRRPEAENNSGHGRYQRSDAWDQRYRSSRQKRRQRQEGIQECHRRGRQNLGSYHRLDVELPPLRTSSSTWPRPAAPAARRAPGRRPGTGALMPAFHSLARSMQLAVVGLHPAARDQDAEIGAVVAVLPGAVDPQIERLLLVADAGDLRGAAHEADVAVAGSCARCRRCGALVISSTLSSVCLRISWLQVS